MQKEDTSQGIRCWTENSRKEPDQLYAQHNKKAQLPDMERIEEPAKGLQRGANIRNVKNDRSCNWLLTHAHKSTENKKSAAETAKGKSRNSLL